MAAGNETDADAGVSLVSTNGQYAILGQSYGTLMVEGSVGVGARLGGTAVDLHVAARQTTTVNIGASGSVSGAPVAITIDSGVHQVDNAGTITATTFNNTGGAGLRLTGYGVTTNSGTITAPPGEGIAVTNNIGDSPSTITNSGSISAEFGITEDDGDRPSGGKQVAAIYNSGDINASNTGVFIDSYAGNRSVVVNRGTIEGGIAVVYGAPVTIQNLRHDHRRHLW